VTSKIDYRDLWNEGRIGIRPRELVGMQVRHFKMCAIAVAASLVVGAAGLSLGLLAGEVANRQPADAEKTYPMSRQKSDGTWESCSASLDWKCLTEWEDEEP
jgi:hypothetical protein